LVYFFIGPCQAAGGTLGAWIFSPQFEPPVLPTQVWLEIWLLRPGLLNIANKIALALCISCADCKSVCSLALASRIYSAATLLKATSPVSFRSLRSP